MPPRNTSATNDASNDDQPRSTLRLLGRTELLSGGRRCIVSPKMADLFALLARHEDGVDSGRLLLGLYGDDGRPGTLKALLSRARALMCIEGPPYRLPDTTHIDVSHVRRHLARGAMATALIRYRGALLPNSDAPGVIEFREDLEEAVRQAALATSEPWLLRRVSDVIPDDLELAEHALRASNREEPANPRLVARVRRLERLYGLVKSPLGGFGGTSSSELVTDEVRAGFSSRASSTSHASDVPPRR